MPKYPDKIESLVHQAIVKDAVHETITHEVLKEVTKHVAHRLQPRVTMNHSSEDLGAVAYKF